MIEFIRKLAMLQMIAPKKLRFITYVIIGGINTVISLSFYAMLIYLGVFYLLASGLAYIFGVIEGYVLNAKFVFKHKMQLKGLLKYSLVYLLSLGINLGLMYLYVDVLHFGKLVAQILTTIVLVFINYHLVKVFCFQ